MNEAGEGPPGAHPAERTRGRGRRVSSLSSPDEVALAAKATVLRAADRAVAERGRFVVALSGGSTPVPLFRLLGREATATDVPWSAFHLFWADEREVPYDHPESNYGSVRREMLDVLPIPRSQVHPIPVDGDPVENARVYQRLLEETATPYPDTATPPIFDLVLLGVGADGHTASIFPGSPAHRLALDGDSSTLVMSVTAPSPPTSRITLTVAALERARETVFVVTGTAKREAVRRILEEPSDPPLPAALIHPISGGATWLLDTAATPTDHRRATRP